nr:MAG TPA: hypothetical protein [Bacteriophage sp.]
MINSSRLMKLLNKERFRKILLHLNISGIKTTWLLKLNLMELALMGSNLLYNGLQDLKELHKDRRIIKL